MRTTKPLRNKTPLKASTKPIKRKTPLKRGGPIKITPHKADKKIREGQALDAARHECEYRDRRFGLGGKCLPCHLGILLNNGERGQGMASAYNHCIPRSRLTGEHNWVYLHTARNLAPTCEAHHEEHDRHPEWWLPLMQQVFGYKYDDLPFAPYLTEVYQRGVSYARYA